MEADLATPAQVRYISALMHRKAEEENRDYTEIRDEIKERHGFKNYSKLSRGEISELIGELEEIAAMITTTITTAKYANT